MHQYQPVWGNMRQGIESGTRHFADAVKTQRRLKEQERQFDIAQQLKQEEFDASKSQFQQNLEETKRQADMGFDISKQELALRNQEFGLKQQGAQMKKEQYDYGNKMRDAKKGIGKEVAQFYKKVGDKESQYRNVLEDQPWYEKAYRDAFDWNPMVESREEAASRQTGYDMIDQFQPNLIEGYGGIAPEEAFRATQQYFPSQFGESENIDSGMSPLMYGGINQFGGG